MPRDTLACRSTRSNCTESLGCLLISLALLSLRQHAALRGALVWIYLIAYGLLRFAIEFFRGDARPMLGILSLNQIFCLGFIAIGAVVLIRRASKLENPRITQFS